MKLNIFKFELFPFFIFFEICFYKSEQYLKHEYFSNLDIFQN
jgi:hypothetical protein